MSKDLLSRLVVIAYILPVAKHDRRNHMTSGDAVVVFHTALPGASTWPIKISMSTIIPNHLQYIRTTGPRVLSTGSKFEKLDGFI